MNDDRKTLILSGASQGIGHATVKRFSDEGWRVITCARQDIPPHCKADPNWTDHIVADLSQRESTRDFIEQANDIIGDGALHALVNNAALSLKSDYRERLGCLNGDLDARREVFELNFFAPLKLCRGFAGALSRGKGAIVNLTSIAGHYVHPFAGSAYSTSKAGLSALTRELATSMIQPEYEELIPRIPMERMGRPEDVAATIFRLCGEDFGYVTGTEVFVTGGQHLV